METYILPTKWSTTDDTLSDGGCTNDKEIRTRVVLFMTERKAA